MNSNTNNRRTCRHARSDDMPSHCLWHTETPDHDRCAPCQAYDAEQARRLRDAREARRQRDAERAVPQAGICPGAFNGDNPNCTGTTAEGNNYGLCESCEYIRRQDALQQMWDIHADETAEAMAVVVQPAVEATAVAVAPQAHDDCCVCMGNEATSWSRLMCGHEVCTPCLGQLQRGDITSRPSPDRYQIGECPNDVICPMCRAPSGNTDPVELHQRLDKYRRRLITIRDEHSRIAIDTQRRFREESERTRRAHDAETKRLRDIANAREVEIATLRRQLAEAQAQRRPTKACDGCSKPQEDDRVPYCNGCMSALYGENWARDNGLEAPAQKVGGGGGRVVEPVVVIPRHQPAVMVGGGGGGPTPRKPCRCPDCQTPKPTQRRCPGPACVRNNRDTPCCKRCDLCPQCR